MTQQASAYGSGIDVNSNSSYIEIIYGLDWLISLTITRLNTPFLFYNQAYGIDVAGMVNKAFHGDSSSWAQGLKQQLLLDTRFVGCDVAATLGGAASDTLTTTITCYTSSGDSFSLVNVQIADVPTQSITWSVQ